MRHLRRGVPRGPHGCRFFVLNTFLADDFLANCDAEGVLAEYHVLAYYYGWGFGELRNLPRGHRQVFCHKVVRQVEAENGVKRDPLGDGAPTHGGKPYREGNH